MACHLNWPKNILISCFQDRLNDDFYNACVAYGAPTCLYKWCFLTEEVETDQSLNLYHSMKLGR